MKILEKTEEKAIDKLLRAQAVRLNSTGADCEGFDADFANAYVEHSLSAPQQKLYESHIAVCARCRKLTVSMMRAYQADASPARLATIASVEKSSSGWTAVFRSLIPAFVTPRFALAATAILAVAITLPLFFLKQNQEQISSGDIALHSSASSSSETQSPVASAAPSPAQSATDDVRRRNEVVAGKTVGAATPDSGDQKSEQPASGLLALATKKEEAKEAAGEPAAPAPPPADDQAQADKKEAVTPTPAKPEETRRGEERSQPRASESATGGAERPLPKIDREGARTLPDGDRSSQPTVVPLAPGRSGVELPGGKDKPVIRPDDSRPKSESRSESLRASRIAEGPSGSKKRDNAEAIRPPVRSAREMKIAGKKFFLLEGIWTQEDYQKNKELPVVPLEQGSELYNQLMAKHSKLKTYFANFADQSAIIVYKGTVYKLTPKK